MLGLAANNVYAGNATKTGAETTYSVCSHKHDCTGTRRKTRSCILL